MLRVAVTGGTGFVGRHLISRHIDRGDQVCYLTRKKEPECIPGAVAHTGSLNSSVTTLRSFLQGADILYHCAAELYDEAEMENTNVTGTANLLAAASGEVGRWIQLSSTGVYGRNRNIDIHEGSELFPANAYEISKLKADNLVRATADEQNLACVLLRPSNVYGTDMPNQSLFNLISMVDKGLFFFVGKPGAVANYIHVENVVDALMLCGATDLSGDCHEFIVSDHRSLEEFIAIIAATLGKDVPKARLPEYLVRGVAAVTGLIPGSPLKLSRVDALTDRTVYRIDKIASELGFVNKISMENGIGELTRQQKQTAN